MKKCVIIVNEHTIFIDGTADPDEPPPRRLQLARLTTMFYVTKKFRTTPFVDCLLAITPLECVGLTMTYFAFLLAHLIT